MLTINGQRTICAQEVIIILVNTDRLVGVADTILKVVYNA